MCNKPFMIVIDDELEVAALVQEVAELVGFEAALATSVREFKALRARREPDVVFSDVCMPEQDAIEMIEELAGEGAEMGVVLMSGFDGRHLPTAEAIAKGYGLSYIGKIQKPFRLPELQALLERAAAWCAGEPAAGAGDADSV